MTQKLLSKPPFRYLHDIFSSTMEATGFGQGLYDEAELDGKSINERDAKINFLNKLIALVEAVLQEKIDVKANKIVAGLEPDKTNLFLQALFRAATSGVDSTPFVKSILGADEGGDDEEDAKRQAEAEEEERQRQEMAKAAKDEDRKRKAKKEAEMKKKQEEEEDRKR